MSDTAAREGYTMICRPFITTKSGKRIFAWEKGKKAFCFEVPNEKLKKLPEASNDSNIQGELPLG
jgi:hypothetical protein